MVDPLRPRETDEEYIPDEIRRRMARDVMLAAFAGLVILALLAWAATR